MISLPYQLAPTHILLTYLSTYLTHPPTYLYTLQTYLTIYIPYPPTYLPTCPHTYLLIPYFLHKFHTTYICSYSYTLHRYLNKTHESPPHLYLFFFPP